MASPKKIKSLARRIVAWKTYLSASLSILESTQLRHALSLSLAVSQIKGQQSLIEMKIKFTIPLIKR